MDLDSDSSPQAEATQLERVVLGEVLDLHPAHLTKSELELKLAKDPEDRVEREEVALALDGLKGVGLVRERTGVVEPTIAALSADALLI